MTEANYFLIMKWRLAGVAELADALDLKSNGYLIPVPVRVRPPARRICGVAPIYRDVS